MRKLATYEGIVEDGHVTLPPNADIPEKTRVYVLVPEVETQRTYYVASPRLVHPEQAKDFELQVIEETTNGDV
jgi:hypothetical protein